MRRSLCVNRFAVAGDEVHFVHAVSRGDRVVSVGFHHANFGSAGRASVAEVNPPQFTVRRGLRDRPGKPAEHERAEPPDAVAEAQGDHYAKDRADHEVDRTGRFGMSGSLVTPTPTSVGVTAARLHVQEICVARRVPPIWALDPNSPDIDSGTGRKLRTRNGRSGPSSCLGHRRECHSVDVVERSGRD
jgi:hypothetical protein